MNKLVLASRSPRRKEILKKFGIPFIPEVSPLIEEFTDAPPLEQVLDLSRAKIEALLDEKPGLSDSLILGADTCIDLNGKIIGKPGSRKEAERMILDFSGLTHSVITGLTLYNGRTGGYIQRYASAEVKFAVLSGKLAGWYADTGEWQGAAGGYRIQEKGALLIESIKGDYYTVMGLPIRLFYGMLSSQDPDFDIGLI